MKKFTYRLCLFAMFMSVLGMIICITSAVTPESYHPLWTLSALLFGLHAAEMAVIASNYKVGIKGWQEEEAGDNVRGERSNLFDLTVEENARLHQEKAELIETLREIVTKEGLCRGCKFENHCPHTGECSAVREGEDLWQWRGVTKEDQNDQAKF